VDILFLAHCVPNPPNKGEKIRAHQEIAALTKDHRVHLVCFARSESEARYALELQDRCASVYVENRPFWRALIPAAVKFAFGGCLNMAFYHSAAMRRYVSNLAATTPLAATIVYALPMAPYAPSGVPILFDMQDVDSEKWLQYAEMKRFGFLYALEAKRMRKHEIQHANVAASTFLTARQETALFRRIAPSASIECMENGVDFGYFDPERVSRLKELHAKCYIVFVGTMDYYPNIDAVEWFATEVLPRLRDCNPGVEFVVVGNNPSKRVLQLGALEGVTITGGVPDVRPYVLQANAVVAPLRLARGIQNKVLEALVLGRRVFVTTGVAKTFYDQVPDGIITCDSPEEYVQAIRPELACKRLSDKTIREAMRARFSWNTNIKAVVSEVESMAGESFATR
jgi:polysaccharide biosynthesis protein PslH